jgi:hypothetical protein
MSTRIRSFLERVIARLSEGSIPVDGGYCQEFKVSRLTTAPRAERGRIPALSAQPLTRQYCA